LTRSAEAAFSYFDDLPPWYCPASPADDTLVFESRFESGNLRRAIQVNMGGTGEGGYVQVNMGRFV
jgi:hypothetical protein